jgi:DNA-binding transcriptional MocR family regulator
VVPIPLPTVGTDEINFRSPVPVRLQLTGIIRQGNAGGEYPAHEAIPSQKEPTTRYGIARGTVHAAGTCPMAGYLRLESRHSGWEKPRTRRPRTPPAASRR